MKGTFRN